jgi:hypothetical protein
MAPGPELTLETVYMLALLVAPAAFVVGALVAYRAGDLAETGGFLLLAAMVGGLSLHFWREG